MIRVGQTVSIEVVSKYNRPAPLIKQPTAYTAIHGRQSAWIQESVGRPRPLHYILHVWGPTSCCPHGGRDDESSVWSGVCVDVAVLVCRPLGFVL